VGHASRSSDLLRVKASRVRFSQFGSKLVNVRRRVVHVAASRRLRRDQVKDRRVDVTGCVGPRYPYFTVFHVLCLRGIVIFLVFCLCL
jgi:hypothetical protein